MISASKRSVAILLVTTIATFAADKPFDADESTLLLLHFDEAGATAKDSSSKGIEIPLLKATTTDGTRSEPSDLHDSSGQFGSALRFPGAHWAHVEPAKEWDLDQQITLEVWVNL